MARNKTIIESLEYLESIINTVREPLIALDQDLRVVKVSRSFYDFFKVKPEETVGKLIYDLGNKQWDIPKLRELLETILPQKATFDDYEVSHDFVGVGRRIMLLNARQIRPVLGKERIILLAIEDITERKRLEEAHNRLAAIVESADDAIIGEDSEGIILSWNSGAETVYGYKAGEIVGKSISLLMPPNHPDEYKEGLAKIGRGEIIKHYDTQRRRKDGRIIDVSLTISPVKDPSGKIIHASTIARDITERKEMEASLEKTRKELEAIRISEDEAREYAESIINTVREPLIALDQDLRVVKVSRSFYEFFKVIPEETMGQLIYDLGNKQWDISKLRELLETILPQKTAFDNYEVEHDFTTIGKRIMLLNARQIQRALGNERVILLAIEDISERREIENGLEKARKDLEAANKDLEAFTYSVSHDLRAPLRALNGFSSILFEEYAPQLPPEAQRYVALVRSNALQMGCLVDDLLAFSRITKQGMIKGQVDPAALVREAWDLLAGGQPERLLNMTVGDLPTCQGDCALLKQVFVNLLSNALKFTRQRDPAVIGVGSIRRDGEIVYFVRDNGVGFDMRYVGKLFDVFQRLHRSEEYEGTGVGLAIVQRIIHRHGGRVWAEAEPDKGATFFFTLEEKVS